VKRLSTHAIAIIAITLLLIVFFGRPKKIGFGKGLFELEFAKRMEKIINDRRPAGEEK
jgi:hypothetical protein